MYVKIYHRPLVVLTCQNNDSCLHFVCLLQTDRRAPTAGKTWIGLRFQCLFSRFFVATCCPSQREIQQWYGHVCLCLSSLDQHLKYRLVCARKDKQATSAFLCLKVSFPLETKDDVLLLSRLPTSFIVLILCICQQRPANRQLTSL